jgi:hypothetical protein
MVKRKRRARTRSSLDDRSRRGAWQVGSNPTLLIVQGVRTDTDRRSTVAAI